MRSFTAIRKEAGHFCGSFLRKGEVFAFVGRNQNLKDLTGIPIPPPRRFCQDFLRKGGAHTVEYEGVAPSKLGGLRDQI